MRAVIVDRYKKKGALRLGEMPEPALRDDDVLVEVHAAGLNLLDSKIRDGEFKLILPYRPPFILGHDVAGTVVRVGSKVRQFKPDDEVYARSRDGRIGTFAEFIAMNEGPDADRHDKQLFSMKSDGSTAWRLFTRQGTSAMPSGVVRSSCGSRLSRKSTRAAS